MRLIDADAFEVVCFKDKGGCFSDGVQWMLEKIDTLPTIQPQTAHWVIDRSGAYSCSKCLEPCATYIMGKPRDKFCKMCGARMVTE